MEQTIDQVPQSNHPQTLERGFRYDPTVSPRVQPVVHLAVGYLCWAGYTRLRYDRTPTTWTTIAVLVGAALPDLIDKPLHWWGPVEVGRTVGHSLLFALALVAIVWVVTSRRGYPRLGVAFAVGYLSHVLSDVPWHVLSGDLDELGFLLWPVTPMPEYTGVKPLGTVAGVEVNTLWLEAVILIVGLIVWWRDGRPGVGELIEA